MKVILSIFLFTVFFIKSYGQIEGCNCSSDKIVSISGGSPFNLNFEGGLMWNRAGAEAGFKTYAVYKTTKEKQVQVGLQMAPYAKGILALLSSGDFHSYVTAYYGLHVYGASLKLGWAISDELMINAEPALTKESGEEINFGITVRL